MTDNLTSKYNLIAEQYSMVGEEESQEPSELTQPTDNGDVQAGLENSVQYEARMIEKGKELIKAYNDMKSAYMVLQKLEQDLDFNVFIGKLVAQYQQENNNSLSPEEYEIVDTAEWVNPLHMPDVFSGVIFTGFENLEDEV